MSGPFKFSSSELEIPLETDERRRTLEVFIAYEAVFNDPLPVDPLNTDNPGFGVTVAAKVARPGLRTSMRCGAAGNDSVCPAGPLEAPSTNSSASAGSRPAR